MANKRARTAYPALEENFDHAQKVIKNSYCQEHGCLVGLVAGAQCLKEKTNNVLFSNCLKEAQSQFGIGKESK